MADGTMVDIFFAQWLELKLYEYEMTQSQLARAAGVTRAAINGVLSGKRGPGPDLCNAIARALKLPPEIVFREAGLLPPKSEADEITERAQHIINTYRYPETRQQALDYLEYLRLQEERGEYRAKPTTRPAPSEQT